MKLKILLLLLTAIYFLSVQLASAQVKAELGSQDGWSYVVTQPGLRSGGEKVFSWGQLFFNKNPIPHELERNGLKILIVLGIFEYTVPATASDDHGWFKRGNIPTSGAPFGKDTISENDLKKGFYFASFKDKKKKTPKDWIFIQGQEVDNPWMAWVDPNRLDNFAAQLPKE